MPLRILSLLLVLLAALPACATRRSYDAALAMERPPEDFWLAATVYAPPSVPGREPPRDLRPARYVIEADRVLRVGVGPGASETFFPDRTRQLDDAQMVRLWRLLRDSSLVDPAHPALVGRGPTLEEAAGRTMYVISYSIGGRRRTLALDADPAADPATAEGADDARRLVDRLAELAWMN